MAGAQVAVAHVTRQQSYYDQQRSLDGLHLLKAWYESCYYKLH